MGTDAFARFALAARLGRTGTRPFERTPRTLLVARRRDEYPRYLSDHRGAVFSFAAAAGAAASDRPTALDCDDPQEFAAPSASHVLGARIGRGELAARH